MQSLRSRLDPHAATVLRLVTRDQPTLRPGITPDVIAAAILAGVILLTAISKSGSIHPLRLSTIYLILDVLLTGFIVLAPLGFAITGATVAAAHTRSDTASLMALTNVSGRAVFQGYFLAVLIRLATIGLLLLVLVPIYPFAHMSLSPRTYSDVIYRYMEELLLSQFVIGLFFPVRMVGLCLLSAVLGIHVGLVPRRSRAEAAAIAGGMALVLLIGFAVLSFVVEMRYIDPWFNVSTLKIAALIAGSVGGTLILTVLPFWLTLHALNQPRSLPIDDHVSS